MAAEDVIRLLDETAVVAIVTTRARGEARVTPIWSVVVDGVPYLRSAYGRDSWWYRDIMAGRPVAFAMGDGAIAEKDKQAAAQLPREIVTAAYVPADDPVQSAVDDALRRKYKDAYGIEPMLSEEAIACTLRIDVS